MNSTVLTASLTGRIQFFYCVALLRTTQPLLLRPARVASIPPFAVLPPRRFREHLLDSTSRLETRVRAPGRSVRPSQLCCDIFRCDILGDVRVPAAEVRKTARRWRCPTFARCFRTSGPHSPSEIPCHRRFASRRPRDPYPRGTHCRAHANRRRARTLTRYARVSLTCPSR